MGYFNAFGYRFYAKKGTTSSAIPVSASGLTEIKNMSNAGIQTSSETQDVVTYDTETLGYANAIITQNSYTIDCTLNIDTADAGYKLMKEAARDAASGITIEWFRETPKAATGGTGAVQYLTIIDPSSAGTPGVKNNLATTTTGSGTGLLVDLTISAGGTASLAVPDSANLGTGYAIGDTVTISSVNATTTGNVVMLVSAITGTGTKERHAGVAFVSNFSEDITAGSVAACTFTLTGYGPYLFLPSA